MNFTSNTYSANLTDLTAMTNVTFISSLPITVNNSSLTFDSVDVIWLPSDPNNPGDNQFFFDDYLVTSEPQTLPTPPQPQLGVLNASAGGPATIRLTGSDGYRFALDYSTDLVTWFSVATNLVSGSYTDFLDSGASGSQMRFYRGRWVP